ncbi:hypothetical protein ACFP47_10260 [Nesterenkonia lacusekhoensis]|uniref:DksA C4-type domain-containing protein n=1 Tax=Nesterenkonia lacusekhoensis TaxID=150832 RepID=A0ABS4T6M2_9MICC|nr:hypothetical protein [Nesterenkonia lacusekhoensis]MBP2319584.1 hypothetical protein [Nesterenkonia lacusekhoensis]
MSDLKDALDQIKTRFDRSKWEGDAFDQISDLERSQADVPRLVAAVEAVLKEHRKVPLYGHEDDCTNTDEEHREEHIQSDDDAGEFYCHELVEDWTCGECADMQDAASLAGPPEWPCPTVRALTNELTGEDDE